MKNSWNYANVFSTSLNVDSIIFSFSAVKLPSHYPLILSLTLHFHQIIGILFTPVFHNSSISSPNLLAQTCSSLPLAFTHMTYPYLACRNHGEVYNCLGMSLLNTHQRTQLGIELTTLRSQVQLSNHSATKHTAMVYPSVGERVVTAGYIL